MDTAQIEAGLTLGRDQYCRGSSAEEREGAIDPFFSCHTNQPSQNQLP